MNWISVSYNQNQTYIVQEKAILDAISNVIGRFKSFKLASKPNVKINDDHSNLQLYLEIKLKIKSDSFYTVIKELSNQLEETIKQMIDVKPKNIQIAVVDFI
ncbi:MMB_0454 family protein [Mycoplasma buteonis]|uniref:MMB_0454 family protein n=1 Tax=Mycoplasma buteonis TaxID=171280 RepID=UPI00056B8B95|nr:hypothetical protein [Mycoplasma buteonis]